jgi:hypothetical protein
MNQNGQNGRLRAELLRQADDTRNKLARTVERIDQRRHDAFDLRKQVANHLKQVALVAGLVIVATAGGTAIVVYRLLQRAQRRRSPWRLPRRTSAELEREPRGRRRSFLGEVLRSVALSAATALLTVPIRRMARAR